MMEIASPSYALTPALESLAREYVSARERSGVALLEAANCLLRARRLAAHGQWLTFLRETRTTTDTAEGLINLAAMAAKNPAFAEAIRSNWLNKTTAMRLARTNTPAQVVDAALSADAPPTEEVIREAVRDYRANTGAPRYLEITASAAADLEARTGRSPFFCPDCGDLFDREVWHCPVCDHHWLMDREECWNCHSYSRNSPEPAPSPNKLAIHHSSATPEHYTPAHIIAAVVDFFDAIDLDPCAEEGDAKTVPARVHYTAANDGLALPWFGRVYMNPPYGRAIDAWVERLVAAYESGEIEAGIALVPARVDTAWFRRLRDFPRCEIRGRLTFVGNDESAPFPSVLIHVGDETERFARAVAHLGDVFVRYEVEK